MSMDTSLRSTLVVIENDIYDDIDEYKTKMNIITNKVIKGILEQDTNLFDF